MTRALAIPALAAALAAPAVAADRYEAALDCVPAEAALDYTCTVRLSRGGAPVEDAAFTVKPDMPSMPLAHNIAPVPAAAAETPGEYAVPLTLDMHGRWVLRLEITAPSRDVVVIDHAFEPE